MASIFTRIIQGEIPAHKLAETEDFLAFLDIRPLAAGDALAIPKKEIDYIFALEDEHLARLIVFAKGVAKAIEAVVPCARIGISVIGLEVPHAHVHLIPIRQIGDMNFSRPHLSFSNEDLAELAGKIRAAYAEISAEG